MDYGDSVKVLCDGFASAFGGAAREKQPRVSTTGP